MERCKTLIDKLQEQLNGKADPGAMLVTVQLLQAELSRLAGALPQGAGSSKISVVLPSYNQTSARSEQHSSQRTEALPIKEISTEDLAPEHYSLPEMEASTQKIWLVDPVLETPTLAHQDEIKELNQKIGQLSGESLNEKLKIIKTEISSFLTDVPVRDMKKAIGINDRFLFLAELFRGDVDMYERSIKTINNFRILPEAEYWIERELKIKLGWDDSSETVKHFYQLVKRRFS